MKSLGFINVVLLVVSAISATTGNAWLLPLIIASYVFLVIVLLGKQDDLRKENASQQAQITALTAQVASFEKDIERSIRLTRHDD